ARGRRRRAGATLRLPRIERFEIVQLRVVAGGHRRARIRSPGGVRRASELFETTLAIVGGQRVPAGLGLAPHRLGQREVAVQPVVGQAVLREVVGTDAFAAVAAADLLLALGGARGLLRALLLLVQPRAQQLHGALAVLVLAALVLAGDDHAGRQVRDAH